MLNDGLVEGNLIDLHDKNQLTTLDWNIATPAPEEQMESSLLDAETNDSDVVVVAEY